MKKIFSFSLAFTLLIATGCSSTGVDITRRGSSGGGVQGWAVAPQDWVSASSDIVNRLLASGRLDRADGKKHVIAISRIQNKTTQHINTNILIDNIIQALQESGKCYATTSFNLNELDNDPLVIKMRQLRNSGEVRKGSTIGEGRLEAPRFSLFGSVTESTARNGRNVEKTYTINIQVNDLETGIRTWTGQYFISKQGKGSARTW
jgi:uncharacterized protein (TIGR02722 family)